MTEEERQRRLKRANDLRASYGLNEVSSDDSETSEDPTADRVNRVNKLRAAYGLEEIKRDNFTSLNDSIANQRKKALEATNESDSIPAPENPVDYVGIVDRYRESKANTRSAFGDTIKAVFNDDKVADKWAETKASHENSEELKEQMKDISGSVHNFKDNAERQHEQEKLEHTKSVYETLSEDDIKLLDRINDSGGLVESSNLQKAISNINTITSPNDITVQESDRLNELKKEFEAKGYTGEEVTALARYRQSLQNAETTKARQESIDKLYDEHPVIGQVAGSVASVASNLATPAGVFEYAKAKLTDTPVDINSPYLIGANTTDELRAGVMERRNLVIGADKNGEGGYDVFDMLYGTAMSSADSVVAGLMMPGIGISAPAGAGFAARTAASAANGILGGGLIGAEAAVSTMQDISESGGTASQALTGGLVAGAFEGLFESFSIGEFNALKESGKSGVKNVLLDLAKSAGVNASEEGLTEIANIMYDTAMNGDISQYQQAINEYISQGDTEEEAKSKVIKDLAFQVLESAAGGALQGVLMGGVGKGIGAIKSGTSYKAVGEQTRKTGTDEAITSAIEAMPQDAKAKKLLDKYRSKLGEGETLSDRQFGKLDRYAGEYLADTSVGQVFADAETTADVEEAYQAERTRLLESGAKRSSEAISELKQQRKNALEMVSTGQLEAHNRVEGQLRTELNAGIAYNGSYRVGEKTDKGTRSTFTVNEDGDGAVLTTGQKIKSMKIADVSRSVSQLQTDESGKKTGGVETATPMYEVTLQNGETKTVPASEIEFADNGSALAAEVTQVVADNVEINAETANFIENVVPTLTGASPSAIALNMGYAFTAGRYGLSMDSIQQSAFTTLGKSVVDQLYKAGQEVRASNISEAQNAVDAVVGAVSGGIKSRGNATVSFRGKQYNIGSIKQDKSLSDVQKGAMVRALLISQASGVKTVFYESKVEDGKRAADVDGEKTTANGFYRDGTVYVDINAGMDGEGTILFTLSHELTHFIHQWSPSEFKKLEDFIMPRFAEKGVDITTLIERKMANSREAGHPISRAVAEEEVVADAMQTMLSDEKDTVINTLRDLNNENPGLFKKLKQKLDRFAESLHRFYNEMTKRGKMSQEGRLVAQMGDEVDELRKLFAEALNTAGQNFLASGYFENNGDSKYSSRPYYRPKLTIDDYTEKQYNNFGWIAVNDVLTVEEYGSLMHQFDDFKNRKHKYPVTKDGEALIITYDKKHNATKIAAIKGTTANPIVTKVIIPVTIPSYLTDFYLEEITFGGQIYENMATFESSEGRTLFSVKSKQDFPPYSDLRKQRRSSKKGRRNSESLLYGSGSSEENTGAEYLNAEPSSTDGGFSDGTRFSYRGENSQGADLTALGQAKQMFESGESSENIRQVTGWFKGYDGKWRYEIDDSKIKLIDSKLIKHESPEGDIYWTANLGDVLKHDNLFESYPELKDYLVIVQPMEAFTYGATFPRMRHIVLSDTLFERETQAYKNAVAQKQKSIERLERTPEYKEYNRFFDTDYLRDNPQQWLTEQKAAENKFFNSDVGKEYYRLNWGKSDFNFPKFERGWSDKAKSVMMHEIQHAIQSIEGFARGSGTNDKNYSRTAGEVESRDVENRLNMTAEQRKNTRPDIDRTDVVFAENGSVRLSMREGESRKLDTDYLSAVESGDMETAQRMVDEAARAEGYTVRAYHGTALLIPYGESFPKGEPFHIFRDAENGIHFGTSEQAKTRMFQKQDNLSGGGYVKQWVFDAYLNLGKTKVVKDANLEWEVEIQKAISEGYNSLTYENKHEGSGLSYCVFSSSQIKSADPVTYDDNGEVIPLSQRFDSGNGDIRYSGRTDVLSWDIDWDANNESSIKNQIVSHLDEINRQKIVHSFTFDKTVPYATALNNILKNWGYKVETQKYGTFLFDSKGIANLRRYVNNDAEAAAAIAAPYVVKRGIVISGHKNHNNNGYPSVTFAGRVSINGKVGIVGVAILFGDKNRVHSMRILTPDGKEFSIIKDDTEMAKGGSSNKRVDSPTKSMSSKNYGNTPTAESQPQTSSTDSGRRNSLRDSEGHTLTAAQQEYFADSKIRDEDGNLLVVYHGTDAEFTVFDSSKSRANMDIQGSFFSPWEIDAVGYGSNVGAYYLNITNPADESTGYKALRRFRGQNEAGKKAREYLISLGYDGVNNGNEEYIAFYPEQIKEVDNLNPTGDPDVRYSERTADVREDEEEDVLFRELAYLASKGALATDDASISRTIDRVKKRVQAERAENARSISQLRQLLAAQGKPSDGKIFTKTSINDIVSRLKKGYNLDVNNNELYDRLTDYFGWLVDEASDISGSDKATADTLAAEYDFVIARALETALWAGTEGTQASQLARDIYDTYWDAVPVKTVQDRNDTVIAALKAKHKEQMKQLRADRDSKLVKQAEEYRARIEALRTEKNARYDEDTAALRDYYHAMMSDIRARRDEAMDEYKTQVKRERQRNWDRKRKNDTLGKIQRKVTRLSELLINPTDTRHIPENLRAVITEFCDTINSGGLFNYKKMNRLGEAFNAIRNMTDDQNDGSGLDSLMESEMVDRIIALKEMLDDKSIRDLTADELDEVWQITSYINKVVSNANKMFSENLKESLSALRESTYTELASLRPNLRRFKTAMQTGLMKPVQFFDMVGSKTLKRLYTNIRNGELRWAEVVSEAKEKLQEVAKQYNYSSWKNGKVTFKPNADSTEVEMSIEEALSIYATWKRDQGKEHLLKGGFILEEEAEKRLDKVLGKLKKGQKQTLRVEGLNIRLDETGLEALGSALTAEQKGYADSLIDFMSGRMASLGNEVTMKMFGIKKFREKAYFPLRSSQNFVYSRGGSMQEVDNRIKNMSMTKKTTPRANNPVNIGNFTEIVMGHCSDMGLYYGLAIPLEDFNRVYNYRFTDDAGNQGSIKQALDNAFGTRANSYIKQLQSDINGAQRRDSGATFVNKMIAKSKKNAVFGSLSVAIQQPSAIARSMMYIDPKYLTKTTFSKRDYDEVKKYAPVAVIKEMGYFDTGVGRTATDWMTQESPQGWKKLTGFITDGSYRDEVLSKLPSLMDEVTWAHIWAATKAEVTDAISKGKTLEGTDLKGIKPGTEEFYKACADRFTFVIDRTQVYDSVFSRSEWMRSKDTGISVATAFMAEPLTSWNMLYSAAAQVRRGDKKSKLKLLRAALAFISATLLNSVLKSIITTLRHRKEDDDETLFEQYVGEVTGNFIDDIFIGNMIPYVGSALDLFQGYDSERMDTQVIANFADAVLAYRNDKPLEEVGWSLLNAIGVIIGVPFANLKKDLWDVPKNLIEAAANDKIFGGTTGEGIKNAAKTAREEATEPWKVWERKSGKRTYSDLVDAYLSGDTVKETKNRKKIGDIDKAKATTQIKERYLSGEISRTQAKNALMVLSGKSNKEADTYLKKQDEKSDE